MININGEQGLGLTWCTTSLCLKANCGRWEHVCTILNILKSYHLFLIILIIKEQVTYIRLPVYFVIIFLIGLTDNYTSHHLLDSPLKCSTSASWVWILLLINLTYWTRRTRKNTEVEQRSFDTLPPSSPPRTRLRRNKIFLADILTANRLQRQFFFCDMIKSSLPH